MRLPSTIFVTLALVAAPVSISVPAAAQMDLPGAVAPTPEGTAVTPSATPRPKPKLRPAGDAPVPAVAAKAPPIASLAGQTLFLNGRKSRIGFEGKDKSLSVSRLTLVGQKLSDPRQDCEVTPPTGGAVAVTDLGRPNGLVRFKLDLPACPITFDVLDGAVLGIGDPPVCEFREADCKVPADGLWGPQPATLGPAQVKTTERARAQAESAVRNDYKLLVSLTKDRPTIMGYARDQAGFTSAREEICRDYSGEGRHNFCSARLTEARVAALKAKIDVEAGRRQLRKAAKGAKPRA